MITYGFTSTAGKATFTPVNLVLNPSATTTSTTNWTSASRTTSIFKTTPASWMPSFYEPTDTMVVEYYDTNMLTSGTRYSLSFWARNATSASGFPLTMRFYAGGNSQQITITPSVSTFEYFKIENLLCGVATNGGFFIDSAGDFYIDDVAIVAGATAI